MKRTLWIVQCISFAVLLNGCGGASTPVPRPTSLATHFSVVTPGTANTGVTFQFTVTALDASNATVTGYSGKVHFTSADSQAKLPADVSLSAGIAQLSATLETAGNQTIAATDTISSTISGTSNAITVTALPALAITSGNPPNGQVGVDYGPSSTADFKCFWSPILGWHMVCSPCSGTTGCTLLGTCKGILNPSPCHQKRQVFLGFNFTATGGLPPYSWALSPNSTLPPELNLSSKGIVTGTPTTPGPFSTAVTVSDSAVPPTQMSANYPIVIAPPQAPVIDAIAHLPIGTLHSPYVGITFTASGIPPFTWSETGALPQGMSPLSADGVLSGTPSQTGTFPITITVQDSFGQSAAPEGLSVQVLAKGFVPTGGLGTARSSHTATLLNNGKVLVTGGAGAAAELTTSEIFDPATKSFSSTGSMSAQRASHTATLLNGGKVLVTGGSDAEGKALASAEIFDPAAGNFAATGSMGAARYSHTATLLNSGKILVTGGLDSTGAATATSELFDPATGTFSPTGNMQTARYFHTATLLNNGMVLVTGGGSATAELFDPGSGTFSTAGSMAAGRFSHTSTLLNNGKVLVSGGYDDGGNALAAAEIFDPANGSFTPTSDMLTARFDHIATLLNDGKVLVAGGLENTSTPLSAAELFDPANGTFASTADMSAARSLHTATLLNDGEILITGGKGVVASVLSSAELYQ